jgi:hypothetical protein
MDGLIKIPPLWIAEAKEAYRDYKAVWEEEELERVFGTGDDPEPAQDWPSFFREYLYAELENATVSNVVSAAIKAAQE